MPEEAIVLAEKHASEIKGLITDVVMPGMSGVQLATILTRVIPGLNVLFVSGHSNESLDRRGVMRDPRGVSSKAVSRRSAGR